MNRFILAAWAAASILIGCDGSTGSTGSTGSSSQDSSAAAAVQPDAVSARALQQAATDERLKRFYEARGWKAAWSGERAGRLLEALGSAERHGLSREEFLKEVEASADPAAREAALTKAALDYADALADGLVDPREVRGIYTLARPDVDVVAGLQSALSRGGVRGWLDGLAPDDPEYRALGEAYVHYRRKAAAEPRREIREGELIRPGERDPRVPEVADALRANGYLSGRVRGDGVASDLYSEQLGQAVKRMQKDFGLAADGVVGRETLEILNSGAAERARQLAVNLERRRWLERRPAETRIDVNVAAAVLDYWRSGERSDHRQVVVGQAGWETPQLGSPIYRLVANPTWTVPKSIEREEIAPKGEGYLAKNKMERRNGWIVQLPGPENALGLVKFDMRNDHSIYLHDTPAKALFNRNQRHFSHGCVRVEDALGFARKLAEDQGIRERFERALATGKETFVDLNQNIPVRLLYHSAFIDTSGRVVFRTDPYGWDEEVVEALGLGSREGRKLRAHVPDVGP